MLDGMLTVLCRVDHPYAEEEYCEGKDYSKSERYPPDAFGGLLMIAR